MTTSDIESLVSAQVTLDMVLRRAAHFVRTDRGPNVGPILAAHKSILYGQLVALSLGQLPPEIDWDVVNRQCFDDIWHPWHDMFVLIREVNPSASYHDIFGHQPAH